MRSLRAYSIAASLGLGVSTLQHSQAKWAPVRVKRMRQAPMVSYSIAASLGLGVSTIVKWPTRSQPIGNTCGAKASSRSFS